MFVGWGEGGGAYLLPLVALIFVSDHHMTWSTDTT